jgi:Tfp pilus assembly protein PilO
MLFVAARPFPEERALLDRRLETLRRILPDAPNPQGDVALVRDMAASAHLAALEVTARPPMESGPGGWVPVEVTAVARYAEVDRFFRLVALSPRLLDVERVTLTAAPGRLVRLAAIVNAPFRSARATATRVPDGVHAQAAAPRAQAEAFVKEHAALAAKSEQIASLRRVRRNPRLFLSELASVVRDRPVVISRATMGDEMLISGLVMGESAMRALQARVERGFFRVAEVLVARQGGCMRFEVRGTAPVVGPDAEIPLPSAEPFDIEDASCRPDRDGGRALVIRTPSPKRPPPGGLNVRLRDVDLADAFQALHFVSGQGFVVDGDVQGRITIDLAGADLERALSLLAKAGVRVSPPGPLRRVSRAEQQGARPAVRAGAGSRHVSVQFKRAAVREVLTLLDEAAAPPVEPVEGQDAAPAAAAAASAHVTWAPPGDLGRISIWARDVPGEALRAMVLDSAGLTETVEEDRRVVRGAGASDTPSPVTTGPPERRLFVEPSGLAALELSLAGVALASDGWVAFAYAPSGALFRYKRGDRLGDATVSAVESTDLQIATDEGPLRVPLADVR